MTDEVVYMGLLTVQPPGQSVMVMVVGCELTVSVFGSSVNGSWNY